MTHVSSTASIADPETYRNGVPHDELARLRRDAPVAWVDEVPLWRHGSGGGRVVAGTGYWAVTRHATIVAVSRRPDAFSSRIRGAFLADPASRDDLERMRQLLINMDAPEHTTIRQLVTSAFTSRTVDRLDESIRHHARSLVQRARRQGQFDLVRDIAAELPLLVLADLLGMPHADRTLMFDWSNNLVGFDDPEFGGGSIERYKRTFSEAFEYATAMAKAKRKQPADDLVSGLVHGECGGRRLSDAEFCHLWILLVVGGNESTRHLLSGSLHALLEEWPSERDRLVATPALVSDAVEELLRWVSPIMQFRRTVARDVDLEGQPLREGDKVALYYTSANRDETVFDSHDTLDLGRTPNPHLAFGVGPHFCLGARLSRLEARVLLETLLPHLASIRLTGPVVRLQSNFMNGFKSMPAEFR